MTISNKSHARKTDKETQSPVLKIFKEIMRRENNDPEKTNLLKEMQEDRKKKKQHSTSKSKSDNKIRDSNSSDRQRKSTRVPFKTNVEQMNVDQPQYRDEQSVPFHSEKKDSWWFWGDDQPKAEEDTCSCVSCALKRICSSENMCIGGYFILFVFSVMLALYLVFKNIPNSTNVDPTEKTCVILDSERLKRKIEMLKGGRHKYSDGDATLKGFDEGKVWDGSVSNNFDGLSGLSDLGSSNLRELNSLEDNNEVPNELSSIMINDNLIDDGTNEHLRNFYKKLIQTDKRIRNLKKGLIDYNTNTEFNFKFSDRAKRSLIARRSKKKPAAKIKKDTIDNNDDKEGYDVTTKFHILYPPLHLLKLYTSVTKKTPDIQGRFKRYDNCTQNPIGLVIKHKKLILRYNPDVESKRIVAKCSHVPKESKSHENNLKHPFYKNTQRLDELLDQFIDKNAPQDPNDKFKTNDLFQHSKSPCKHPKIIKNSNLADDNANSEQLLQHLTTETNNGNEEHTLKSTEMDYMNKKDLDSDEDGTDTYKAIMSISTLLNSEGKSVTVPNMHKDPRLRKLMQFDEKDDESHGYGDFNEVLDDNTGTNDDNDKESDRIKRTGEMFPNSNQLPNNPNNHNPKGVLNPNWKGPMPLYPDELSSMIKQAALNFNKIQVKLDKDGVPETIEGAKELSDMEYVEDYLSSKNDRLVKMAQAYSDYGVLEGKKETIGKVTTQVHNPLEKRVKLETSKRQFFNGGLLGKLKKHNPTRDVSQEYSKPATEGIRFELRPTSVSREDNPKDVFEMLRKHVKVVHNNGEDKQKINAPYVTSEIDSYSPMKFHVNDEIQKYITSTTTAENKYNTFTFPKGKRSLLSIDLVDDFESKNNNGEDGEFDDADQEKYAVNLGIEKNNDSLTVIKREKNQIESFNNSAIQNRFIKKIDAKKSSIRDGKDITTIARNNSEVKKNDSSMVFSDFFSLLAKCFGVLDGVDLHRNKHESNHSSNKTDANKQINSKKNKSSELIYPMYDSDMVDNIGHRSRVLMSIEKNSNITIDQKNKMTHLSSDGKKKTDKYSITTDKNTEFPFNFTTTPLKAKSLTKATTKYTITNNVEKKGDKKNKTIVKRNAEDSNLIFWNDIYDEEYGVQLDPLENTIRDKDSVMTYNNLMRNSKLWLRTKIQRLKDNMRRSTQKATNKLSKKRPSRSLDPHGTAIHEKGFNVKHNNKVFKRDPSYNLDDEDLDAAKGTNFAELTENMKKVCQKAARAVQITKNKEVREDTKEETAAVSLMQQLVHLMTDLVDYQVQQKTCVKLPPDLSSFLVWLTSPNQESDPFKMPHHVHDAVDILSSDGNDDGYHIPGLPETIPSSSEKEENHPESRSECLGTLQAVQELMHEFDAMSDGDKSKMTGIREYLLNQMEYLNQQLYNVADENYTPEKIYSSIRYKRLANKNRKHKKRRRRRAKRKLHKFIKNFSKKHTRSTASYYEIMQETESESERKAKVRNDKPKRNLKDVYFKAVLDAKKATIKNIQRKDDKKEKGE